MLDDTKAAGRPGLGGQLSAPSTATHSDSCPITMRRRIAATNSRHLSHTSNVTIEIQLARKNIDNLSLKSPKF